jgi:hypothetical protein
VSPAWTVLVLFVALSGCSSSTDGLRTFELAPVAGGIDAVPVPEPEMPSGMRSVEAVILEAPVSVAADEEFEVVIELRNGAMEAITLSPCPWFHASFGESGTVSAAHGEMPCEAIGAIGSGERILLRLRMTAPSPATAGEDGWATLGWQLGTIQAHIPLPMEGV